MFSNYFKIAIRNLRKNKVYSLINITGLAIGIAGFILITIFIKTELAFDTFHPNAERIYRPVEIQKPRGVDIQHVAVTMAPLAEALKSDFPEIEQVTRVMRSGNVFVRKGEMAFYEDNSACTDPSFFDLFKVEFIHGNPETALNGPHDVILNREIAEKFFPNQNPLGETLELEFWFGKNEYKVTGVIENYPENSHLVFSMLANIDQLDAEYSDMMNNWDSNFLATYVLLKEGTYAAQLEEKFPAFLDRHLNESSWNTGLEMYLQPLTEIHLFSDHIRFQTYNNNQGSIDYIYIFAAIALFILLIACINFMNLSTARSVKRAREVGIRKVMGSQRKELIAQFLGESIIISFIALILAVGLAQTAIPFVNEVSGRDLVLGEQNYAFLIPVLIGVAILTGIFAGIYPAFFLSAFRPIETLKAQFNIGPKGRSAQMRKLLVVTQFTIAIALIICTGIVINQMDYIRNKNLGFNREQLMYLPIRGEEESNSIEQLKSTLAENPQIISAAASSGQTGVSGNQSTRTVAGTNGEVSLMMRISYVDFDLINTMEMELVDGRNFSREFATDTSQAVIINETAVRELGWENPIGMQFEREDAQPMTVIGVVKDFQYNKMTRKIEPLFMNIDPERYNYLMIRVRPENITQTLDFIEQTWTNLLPGHPYEYGFMDEYFERMYRAEQNMGRLFGGFSTLAILVACLGLVGLVTFTAEQRTKEIGIRKILGATVPNVIWLLSKEFLLLVTIALAVSAPIAGWLMRRWLENFVEHAGLNGWIFLLAGVIALAIALLSVSFQAIRTALANPVKTLRYE